MSQYEDDDDDDFDEEDEEDEERLETESTSDDLGVEEARPDDDFPNFEQQVFDAQLADATEEDFARQGEAFRQWGIENGYAKDDAPATTAEEE